MRRSGRVRRIASVACLMLALTGCVKDTKDAWAGRGKAVPVANEPAPTPAPGGMVEGLGGLRMYLEARVVATGGLIRPVKSECDTVVIAPSFTCRITYLGQVVTYQVTTQARSSNTYDWHAKPDSMVATRAGIEMAMWRRYAARAGAMSCDTSLPERQRVPPGTKLRQRCYFKPTFNDKAFGKKSTNGARTVAVEITVHDGSLGFDEKTQ